MRKSKMFRIWYCINKDSQTKLYFKKNVKIFDFISSKKFYITQILRTYKYLLKLELLDKVNFLMRSYTETFPGSFILYLSEL